METKAQAFNPIHNFESMKAVIDEIKFKEWEIYFNDDGAPYLQVRFKDRDFYTGRLEMQYCRKWKLTYKMVNNEIVRTAYKAVCAAVQHEVDECFTYKGVRPYHPHMDVDKLVEVLKDRKKDMIQIRPDQRVYAANAEKIEEPKPEPMIVTQEIGGPKEVDKSYRKHFHGVEE